MNQTVFQVETLMATKHAIRENTGGFGERKRKGRQDTCENVKTCHVVREVVVLALLQKALFSRRLSLVYEDLDIMKKSTK